jgi:hypothetical protein
VAGADPRPAHLVPAGWWKRRAIEAVGWLLFAAGLAALVLPGPGLLFLVAGLALALLIYTFRRYRIPSVDPKSDPTP